MHPNSQRIHTMFAWWKVRLVYRRPRSHNLFVFFSGNYFDVVNPPAPIACPIGGRYTFKQYGRPEEMYWTRIRGITERPRHMIDCMEWVSIMWSCSDNPTKLKIDAEYCNTLDHTGKPIGEYGTRLTQPFIISSSSSSRWRG